ncbi:putative porin [Ideonella sp. DXS22W]|uniref:Porin n=1 Tax=Pseudaquabacterium inlustre TaxID=2984192 RepID=A0ABU9CH16_9BURK
MLTSATPLNQARRAALITVLVASALGATMPVQAQSAAGGANSGANGGERAELERLRATTLGLIDALVSQGLLTRERAEAIVRQASGAAGPAGHAAAADSAAPAWGTPPRPAAAPVVRVPYISETQRAQLREEIRNEVLSAARDERWADPRQIPDWTQRIQLEGDLRVRGQAERMPGPVYERDASTGAAIGAPCDVIGGNMPAECFRRQTAGPAWAPDLLNTGTDRNRLLLRARLGVNAKVSEDVSAGLRLSTGSTSGPTSSSQTLGSGFNKASLVLDRAWLRWEPRYNLRLLAGRLANPFMSSDLTWPEDLSFDGVAAQGELTLAPGLYAFGTAGAFPLEEFNVDKRDKWLYALQGGVNWAFSSNATLRLGLAVYDFNRIEGVRENDVAPAGARDGTVPYLTSQYPGTVRLKGNTLINLRDPSVAATATPVWGLASRFRPVDLTAQLRWTAWDTMALDASLDWVKNTGFDLADIRRRSGLDTLDTLARRTNGLQARLALGSGTLASAGDWQVSATWRRFERDAWVDGFTDTTWHLGGTNYAGWQLGGQYAFDRRSTVGLRLTSTHNLDDGVRVLSNGVYRSTMSSAPLKIEVLQLDVTTRF